MRCLRSCFCLPDCRKKPKSSSISSRYARCSSYRPLASFLYDNDDAEEVGNPRSIHPLPSIRESCLTRKKVRFDLNVQAYEPIPPADSDSPESDAGKIKGPADSDSPESDAGEIVGQKCREEMTPIFALTEGSAYPSNYRYQNCRDISDEEDDGFLCDDSDVEFEHNKNDCFGDDKSCRGSHHLDLRSRKDEAPTWLDSVCSNSEEKEREPCTAVRSSENARLRNHYVHSVLNPVENTVQWKTVKARVTLPNRKSKENIESERELEVPTTSSKASEQAVAYCKSNSQTQHVPMNASLSIWLVPVEN